MTRLPPGKTTVIIPTGGTEQNGPIMVLGKHNYLVRYKAGEIAKQLGNAIVAPVMAHTRSGEATSLVPKPAAGHMRFPGTITTPEDAYEKDARIRRAQPEERRVPRHRDDWRQRRQSDRPESRAEMLNKEWPAPASACITSPTTTLAAGDAIAAANGMSQEAIGSHAGSQRHDAASCSSIPACCVSTSLRLGKRQRRTGPCRRCALLDSHHRQAHSRSAGRRRRQTDQESPGEQQE
mgnify:CR=1 FL=1